MRPPAAHAEASARRRSAARKDGHEPRERVALSRQSPVAGRPCARTRKLAPRDEPELELAHVHRDHDGARVRATRIGSHERLVETGFRSARHERAVRAFARFGDDEARAAPSEAATRPRDAARSWRAPRALSARQRAPRDVSRRASAAYPARSTVSRTKRPTDASAPLTVSPSTCAAASPAASARVFFGGERAHDVRGFRRAREHAAREIVADFGAAIGQPQRDGRGVAGERRLGRRRADDDVGALEPRRLGHRAPSRRARCRKLPSRTSRRRLRARARARPPPACR